MMNAPVATVLPPELWDARLSCGQRLHLMDGKLYNVRFTMEVRGKSVNLHRQNDMGVELMSGEIYNGTLTLTGNGYLLDDEKRRWDYSLTGAMPPGATTYLAKGAMLGGGKVVRECQLSATLIPATKQASTAAPSPAPGI
jgi:hypothetical protein